MTTSRMVPALIALFGMTQATMPAGVQVFLGKQPVTEDAKDFVLIGVDDPTSDAPQLAIDGEQVWEGVGGKTRDETFTIYGTYVAWTGDNDYPGCLARADTNLGLLQNALRVNQDGMSLNGALIGVGSNTAGWCGMGLSRVSLLNLTAGTAVHVQFVVICRARI